MSPLERPHNTPPLAPEIYFYSPEEIDLAVDSVVQQPVSLTGTSVAHLEDHHFARACNFDPRLCNTTLSYDKDITHEKIDLTPLLSAIPEKARICVTTPTGFDVYTPSALIASESVGWNSKKALLTLFHDVHSERADVLNELDLSQEYSALRTKLSSVAAYFGGSVDKIMTAYDQRVDWVLSLPKEVTILYYYCYNRGLLTTDPSAAEEREQQFAPFYESYELLKKMFLDVRIDNNSLQEQIGRLLHYYVTTDPVFAALLVHVRKEQSDEKTHLTLDFPHVSAGNDMDVKHHLHDEISDVLDGMDHSPVAPLAEQPILPLDPMYFEVPTVPVISQIQRYENPYKKAHILQKKRTSPIHSLQSSFSKAILAVTALTSIAGAAVGVHQLQQQSQQKQPVATTTPQHTPTVRTSTPTSSAPAISVQQQPTLTDKLQGVFGKGDAITQWISKDVSTVEQERLRYDHAVRTLEILQSHGGMSIPRLQNLAQKAVEKDISFDLFLRTLLALPQKEGNGISQNLVEKYQQLHQKTRREILTSPLWKQAVRENFTRTADGHYAREDIRDFITTKSRFFLGLNGTVVEGDPLGKV